MQSLLDSDSRLIEQLKDEKSALQSELASTQVEVNKLVNDCLVQRK